MDLRRARLEQTRKHFSVPRRSPPGSTPTYISSTAPATTTEIRMQRKSILPGSRARNSGRFFVRPLASAFHSFTRRPASATSPYSTMPASASTSTERKTTTSVSLPEFRPMGTSSPIPTGDLSVHRHMVSSRSTPPTRSRSHHCTRRSPHQLRQLIDSGKSVDIPAEHRGAFTSRFVFKLGSLAPVISSDGAYNPPTVSGPRLQLMATYADNHRIDIESAWKYTVDADELIISTADTTTDESEIRNHVAEDAIAKSLGAAAAKATLAGTLTGLDSMQFTLDLLPQLEAHDAIDLTVAGTPADYRPADDAVVIGLSTSAPDGDSGSDWFDLDVTVDVAGQSVPFTTLFSALSKGETHILLPDGAFFRLDAPELLGLHRLTTEARSLLDRPTGKLGISKFQAGLWEELTALGRVEHQAAAWKKQIAGLLGSSGIDPVEVPDTLTATLRPYQVDGFRWLNFLRLHNLGGIPRRRHGPGQDPADPRNDLRCKAIESGRASLSDRRSHQRGLQLEVRSGDVRTDPPHRCPSRILCGAEEPTWQHSSTGRISS